MMIRIFWHSRTSICLLRLLRQKNGIQYAKIEDLAKYTSLIEEYLDYAYNGMQTPEEAMKGLADQAKMLQ